MYIPETINDDRTPEFLMARQIDNCVQPLLDEYLLDIEFFVEIDPDLTTRDNLVYKICLRSDKSEILNELEQVLVPYAGEFDVDVLDYDVCNGAIDVHFPIIRIGVTDCRIDNADLTERMEVEIDPDLVVDFDDSMTSFEIEEREYNLHKIIFIKIPRC